MIIEFFHRNSHLSKCRKLTSFHAVFYFGRNSQLNAFLELLTKHNMALTSHRFKAGERGKNGFIAGNKTTSEFFLQIPSCQIHIMSDSQFSL